MTHLPDKPHTAGALTVRPERVEAPSPNGWVVVASIDGQLSVLRVPDASIVHIGRLDADVVIDHPSVSRLHAHLHARGDGELELEDARSTNGTKVNGRSLREGERVRLVAGAVLELGSATLSLQRASTTLGDRVGFDTPAPPSTPSVARMRSAVEPRRAAPVVLRDPRMIALYAGIETYAATLLPVTILGETGVGKERLAEAIHARSGRAGGGFVRINCAAIPESLLESELFGHAKGAFTGAVSDRRGLVEAAEGGTLFLDEIGELPFASQSKILRFLERREILRVGSSDVRTVDVRFIAATNRDLASDVTAGRFRADLYYRLNGVCVTIPPLRDRPLDILAIAEATAIETAKLLGRGAVVLTADAIEALRTHRWSGNVRELRSAVERAVTMGRGRALSAADLALDRSPSTAMMRVVSPVDLPAVTRPLAPVRELPLRREEMRAEFDEREREEVVAALRATEGNQTRAATLLGVSRRTLITKMEKFGLDRPRKRSASGAPEK
ncbi:MAG: sigma 54-interacting transcriptional regulator [Polyangiales bacterium]